MIVNKKTPVCPHCFAEGVDNGQSGVVGCLHCTKLYKVQVNEVITYNSVKIPCEELGLECEYRTTTTFSGIIQQCKKCGGVK